MTCKNCGQEVQENASFCANCGTKIEIQQPVPVEPAKPSVPFENKPLSPWAYFGYQILFSIPLVGFIMLIILSTKAAQNVNLRNFARSYWCALLIVLILCVIGFIVGFVFGSLLLPVPFEEISRNVFFQ